MTDTDQTVTISITRLRQYKSPLRNERANWKYTYVWSASDGSHIIELPDGRRHDLGSYGTHLGGLKDMLRRRYGPRVKVVQTWDTPAAEMISSQNFD